MTTTRCPICRTEVEVRYIGELDAVIGENTAHYGVAATTYRCVPRGHLFARDDYCVA